jgi:VIT1/CCC1 family predicted Fe2+/Mn2+ transporter
MELNNDILQKLKKFQQQELTGYIVYQKLAKRQKKSANKDVLNKIAFEELKHYDIYKKYTLCGISPMRLRIWINSILAFLVGPTFVIRYMELSERKAQSMYAELSHLPEIEAIIKDEEEHEEELMRMLKEDKLEYIGSVVLGMNDALVELTGALAGLTLALQNSNLIALTGLITGIAASFSMAASEYLSTKSEETTRHALTAAVYTGIAYLATIGILILPYLLIDNVYTALAITLGSAIVIIALFNFYYAVVKSESFVKRFIEMLMLSFGVALFSFGVGYALRSVFHIEL